MSDIQHIADAYFEGKAEGRREAEAELRELLQRLAPEEPMNQDEQGGCVWCDGKPFGQPYGYAGADPEDHMPDCPWVEARKIIEGA